jgi:tRNA pseudouridine-54 N-methylase
MDDISKRKKYSEAQQTALVTQVNRVCPLCARALFYQKKNRSYKDYELAHIYPLNPTSEEKELLKNEERLSEDVNDEKNIIPLCKICHGQFDTPRTVDEYRDLLAVKKRLIARTNQEQMWNEYKIEEEISEVIKALYNDPDVNASSQIDFTPKKVDDKLNATITNLTKRKVKNNVRDYYLFVKGSLSSLDQKYQDLSEVISYQVKTYYLKQKGMGITQQEIFENVVAWLNVKTKPETPESTEILASFYVQNCEIF